MKIKATNVAGAFYPGDKEELHSLLDTCFQHAKNTLMVPDLKAIIVPHAGYIYSGEVAASAYQVLEKIKNKVKTVVVFSPSHHYGFEGVALSDATHFNTPLGNIEVNQEAQKKIRNVEKVEILPQAFEKEHALEVHLPFLQKVLNDFSIVPMIVGQVSPQKIKELIELLDSEDVFFIVSSDLSHFHDYKTCQEIDGKTDQRIEQKDIEGISGNDACGYYPLRGLLLWAKENDLNITSVDLRNSGDTAGDKSRVVGYGSYLIY